MEQEKQWGFRNNVQLCKPLTTEEYKKKIDIVVYLAKKKSTFEVRACSLCWKAILLLRWKSTADKPSEQGQSPGIALRRPHAGLENLQTPAPLIHNAL
jgi:hypothetical protein